MASVRRRKTFSLSYETGYEGLYWTVKRIKGHKCNLIEDVEPVAKFIESGWCVPLRRWFKRYSTVSENSAVTKAHFRSVYKIRIENMRHLEKFYYMIHPFSDGRLYWDVLMLIVHITQLTSVPMLIMSSRNLTVGPITWFPFLLILTAFCVLDIIIIFFCGYYDEAEQKIVLDPKRVAIKYLKSFFIFDLIAVCQANYIAVLSGWFKPQWYYNIQWLARFTRISGVLTNSAIYGMKWNMPGYVFRTFSYIHKFIIAFFWVMYMIYVVQYLNGFELVMNWKSHLKIALELEQNILLVKIPESMTRHPWFELLIYMGLLHAGFFLQMFIAAQILQIFICRNLSKNKYNHLLNQIKAYTRFKQVPQKLNSRIKSYVEFKFQKTVFKEMTIIDTLSTSLKNEVLWHLCQNIVTRVDIFKDIPPNVMMRIVMLLKQEIYLPNDVVVQTGETGTEMYFTYVGVLAVYTPTGREICHLTDGDHFGEIALLLNETRVASVVAIDFCELYRLSKKDFNDALEAYPAAKTRILELGQERFRQIKLMNESVGETT